MKEIRCVDPEQCDSYISAFNAQGFKADRRYDSDQHCWYVWKIEENADVDKPNAA